MPRISVSGYVQHLRIHYNGRLRLRTAMYLQVKVRDRGLGLRPRLNAGPVRDAQCPSGSVSGFRAT